MLHRPRPAFVAALVAVLLAPLLPAPPAAAQVEPIGLADDPFRITDPRASAPGEGGLTVVTSYDRARRGEARNTFGVETEAAIGVVPGLEIRLGQEGSYGNLEVRRRLDALGPDKGAGEAGAGTRPNWGGLTQFGALYQLTEERGTLPTLGVIGRLRLIYGPGSPAREAEVLALVGKTVIGGPRPLGVHLNLGSAVRLDPLPGERRNRYLVDAAIGQTVSHNTALVVAYVREQQERGDRDYSLVQAGLRHRLPAWGATFGLAVGIGTNRDSPRLQVAFAMQWELGGGGR